jgi:hypothetical protein
MFVRSGQALLRDGGIQRAALNGVLTDAILPEAVARVEVVRTEPRFRSRLFEPIPLEEIGPCEHPWRAADDSKPRP